MSSTGSLNYFHATVPPNTAVLGGPASDGTRVVYGDSNGRVYALAVASGTVLWSGNVTGAVVANGVYANSNVVIVSSLGHGLYGFGKTTGAQRWSYAVSLAGGVAAAAPALSASGDVVYVSSSTGFVSAVNMTGDELWSVQLTDAPFLRGVTADPSGAALYVANAFALCRLNAATGATMWCSALPTPLAHAPALDVTASIVYVCGVDHNLYALGQASGDRLFTVGLRGAVGQPVVSGARGIVYVGNTVDGTLSFVQRVPEILESGECIVSSLARGRVRLANALHIPGAAVRPSDCENAFVDAYCGESQTSFRRFRSAFCAAYRTHGPWSCTRERRRSILEALSLAFGFSEIIYISMTAVTAYVLWHFHEKHEREDEARRATTVTVTARASEPGKGDAGDGGKRRAAKPRRSKVAPAPQQRTSRTGTGGVNELRLDIDNDYDAWSRA